MNTCVIVDAYGPAIYFVELLKERGFNVIHVQSAPNIPPPFVKSIEAAGFIEQIFEQDLEQVVLKLAEYRPTCVIAGFETGVLLADQLSEELNLKTNGTSKSNARRSKYEMMEALRENSVPCVKYLKTHSAGEAINWVNEHLKFPIVIKPVNSASSDDVYICRSENDITLAANKILNKKNMMGCNNDDFLVQEYLQGTEYVVNTVSCDGKHYVSDMWICKKRIVNNRVIYDKEELLPSTGDLQKALSNYIYTVLDALEINHGPAHSEMIFTNRGPILLETGARVGGAVLPGIHRECFGHNQIDLTIDAYINPEAFSLKAKNSYQIKKHLFVVMLISTKEGIITQMPLMDKIKKLSTVTFARFKKKIGDNLFRTIDLSSSPGTIYMMSEEKNILENEYETLLALVDDGFIVE